MRVGRKTYVVDMAAGDERTDFVALGNTFIGGILLICALVGALGQWFSLASIIAGLSAVSISGGILAWWLPEVEVLAEKT